MGEIPDPPSDPMAKFRKGPDCSVRFSTVVDHAYNFDGDLCCSSCRGILTWNNYYGWVHAPKSRPTA